MQLPVTTTGEGPDVVLVHGRGSNLGTWEPVMPHLGDYRVHRVDLLGHGEAPVPDTEVGHSMASQLEALTRGLADVPRPFTLVGHSMGGFLALRYALSRPGDLCGLVLSATSADPPFRGGRHARASEAHQRLVELAESEGMQAVCDALNDRERLHPRQCSNLLRQTPLTYAATVRAIRDMEPISSRLGEIRVPTLVLCGYEDEVFLPECRALAERIPGAEGVFLQGSGHSPHREVTGPFMAPVLRFLSACSSSSHVGAARA